MGESRWDQGEASPQAAKYVSGQESVQGGILGLSHRQTRGRPVGHGDLPPHPQHPRIERQAGLSRPSSFACALASDITDAGTSGWSDMRFLHALMPCAHCAGAQGRFHSSMPFSTMPHAMVPADPTACAGRCRHIRL